MKPVVCLGEMLVQLTPGGNRRLRQAMPGQLNAAFAGAEANVAVVLAQLGAKSEFLSALPSSPISEACVATLRAAGVETSHMVFREQGRFGLYYLETGAAQRGSQVIYDRQGSTFSLVGADGYDWEGALSQAGWFHTSGIAAAVSSLAAGATTAGILAARKRGIPVSFDLNFRRKLWQWQANTSPAKLAQATLEPMLENVDLLIGNPCDLAATLGEENVPLPSHTPASLALYEALARRAATRFPQLKWIALTLRQHHTASNVSWGALLMRTEDGAVFLAPHKNGQYRSYEITPIVDRVGSGDAFAGALIFALQTPELADPAQAVAFAAAAGCLAHSIPGDFCFCSRHEIEALMGGEENGHLSR